MRNTDHRSLAVARELEPVAREYMRIRRFHIEDERAFAPRVLPSLIECGDCGSMRNVAEPRCPRCTSILIFPRLRSVQRSDGRR